MKNRIDRKLIYVGYATTKLSSLPNIELWLAGVFTAVGYAYISSIQLYTSNHIQIEGYNYAE